MDAEIGEIRSAPNSSSKQTAAWIEHELHELAGSSVSASSSDEHSNRKKKHNEESSLGVQTPRKSSIREYPSVVIPSSKHPSIEPYKISRNAKTKERTQKASHLQHESSDTEQEVITERSDTSKRSAVLMKQNFPTHKTGKGDVVSEVLNSRYRQLSAEESSLDGSQSMTSQSDTRSYRERLRDRFHNMREAAGNQTAEAKFRHYPRKYIRKQAGRLSKTDELLQREEMEIEAALEKHELSHQKENSAPEKSLKVPAEEAAFDFFTKQWEVDAKQVGGVTATSTSLEEDKRSPTTSAGGIVADDLLEGTNGDKIKLLAADYLEFSRDEWEVVDHSSVPIQVSSSEIAAKEAQLLFYPSSDAVPLEERLGSGKEVRYREEEGLFVGNRPKVSSKNCHRLENRLFMFGGRHWFGDNGELINEPDPIRSVAYRPPVAQATSGVEVEFVAGVHDVLPSYNVGVDGVHYAMLEINISTLVFQHHPLFSLEHVLAQRLTDLFSQYRHRTSLNQEERTTGKLQFLRQAHENLQVSLDSNNADTNQQQLDRLKRYKEEIRNTRQELFTQSFCNRQLLISLLSCWRDLKKLRETQCFTNTPHKLIIHRERLSQEQIVLEKAQWEAEIRRVCNEVEVEQQEEYSRKWDEYQTKLEAWRKQQARMKNKAVPQKKNTTDGDDEDSNSEKTSQSGLLDGETYLEEPTEPLPVDVATVRSNVIDKMVQCLRPPGEPKLKLSLSQNGSIDDDVKDVLEMQRRAALKRCRLFVRIFYNNKEVCRTHSHNLTSRFSITFNECFSIRIVQPPEILLLMLFEDGAGGGRHHLADIYLPFPSRNKTMKTSVPESYEFSSDRVATFSHAGVGSGTFISGSPGINGCMYTSGSLSVKVGWGTDNENKKILAPQEKYFHSDESETYASDLLIKLGKKGTISIDKLREWADKAQLDPNDPANASFLLFLKSADGSYSKEPDFFRLNPLQSGFDFCEMSTLESNPRLRLLLLRAQGEQEFRDWTFVPIREKEIPTHVFSAYEKRLTASARETEMELDAVWSDPLCSHRAWGQLYLERVYQRVLAQCKQAQRTANLQHVIVEDQVPDISTLGLTFMKWLQPKRPLRPMRKERKKIAVQSLAGQDVRLMIYVIRAFEVPVRKNMDPLGGSMPLAPPTNLGFATVPVRPFVEVSFQGTTLRTTTAEGANPTWNQDMQFPVRHGNCDSDTLFIHLFDEVLVDLVEDDRLRETSIHQRLEKHWLASLHIPFTTLVHNARIEGTFKMYSPPVLLGYERESHQRANAGATVQPGTFSLDQGGQLFPFRDATFINLFITVQPSLNPPEPFSERLDSTEVPALEEHLIRFEKEMEVLTPHRKVKTLVIDVSGKSVCITRFFRPLSPPIVREGETTTDEMAARFVSMVPKNESHGMFDIWLTCDQVLRLGWGDTWAHAVLLCCYLLGLGRSAWLLVGSGIPHGQMAYVLVREKHEYWVWDPLAGQRYSIYDSFCPLQRVYGLINDENIWINQQKEELPRRTQFDLGRRSDWMPALGRRGALPAPVGSVQPSSLHYSPTSSSAVSGLQDKLEKHLRDCVMKWRRTQTTHWNRYCIATLRKVLPYLEQASCSQSGESASPHHTRELQHILAAHKMCGFPINIPFTTVEAVVDAVRATGVHLNQDELAEFALAVYIHPFPNNILSVWVYIASLIKLR